MPALRVFFAILFLGLLGYTLVVISQHGINLLPVFFGDIAKLAWPGQFNVDFMCFLSLSALWLAWRHHFSALGWLLGLCGFFGGALFLLAYLFIVSLKVNNDIKVLMLGEHRNKA